MEPVFLGEPVALDTENVRLGRTSINVKVMVEVECWGQGEGQRMKVTEAEVALAAVDDRGQPTPIRPSPAVSAREEARPPQLPVARRHPDADRRRAGPARLLPGALPDRRAHVLPDLWLHNPT